MLRFFQKLLGIFWGHSSDEADAASQKEGAGISAAADPATDTPSTNLSEVIPQKGLLQFHLIRYSPGQHDTLGKLYLDGKFACYTLEPPEGQCIEEGTYEVELRKQGGKHSAYWYRFKELHKGMLWVRDTNHIPFAYICIGNKVEESQGSILLGTEVVREKDNSQAREIWHSESAYLNIYPGIAGMLEEGQSVNLTIG